MTTAELASATKSTSSASSKRDDICYHHFSLTFDPSEVPSRFKDVRFVLVAGCSRRAEAHAEYLSKNLFNSLEDCQKLTSETSRFSLFKVGPVLLADHGMGPASMSIALHELFLMCQQAQTIEDITLIRFGTCGGIGVPTGTVCITNRALDPFFNEYIELKICLKLVKRSSKVDPIVAETLAIAANSIKDNLDDELGGPFEVRMGATIGTNDFYEEQGRTNGAICDHSHEDKITFLKSAGEKGVINMEMESNYLAAMCNKLAVRFGVICVALNNRLLDDRVLLTQPQKTQFERRLFCIIAQFIRKQLDDTRTIPQIVKSK